jgi:hypothetical protein
VTASAATILRADDNGSPNRLFCSKNGRAHHHPSDISGNAEETLVNREKEAHDRAKALFKRNENRRVQVAAEHEAEADAVREKTVRLRALRLEAAKAEPQEKS